MLQQVQNCGGRNVAWVQCFSRCNATGRVQRPRPCPQRHSPAGEEVAGQGQVGAVTERGTELPRGICGEMG